MISKGTYTVQEIQNAAEAHFAIIGTGKGTGYKQYKRWEYQALRSMKDNGVLKSPQFYINELQRYNNYLNQNSVNAKNVASDTGTWEQLGPTGWNATSGWNPGTGRITSIAFAPGNENHIIVGAETGGVWKTTNGLAATPTWTPLCDNYLNMKVYSLAIDPTNASNYFWGSADGTIYKSSDAGSTWTQLASTIASGDVNKILIDPSNTAKMYCSIEYGGLYKSTNSGVSWTLIHPSANSNGYDFEFKPGDYNTVYASGTSLFKSTDGGATFAKIVAPTGVPVFSSEYVNGTLDWKSTSIGSTNFGVTVINPKTGSGLGLFDKGSSGASGNKTKIITPALDLSTATSPVLKFSYAQPNFSPDVDILKVYYKTSAAGAWVQLANYTIAQESWLDVTLSLPNPSATYYVAFEGEIHSPNNGGGVTLDDVSVEATNLGVVFSNGFETPTPNVFGTGAKMLAVSANNPSVVYMVEASGTSGAHFKALYQSTDSGTLFTELNHTGKNYFGYELTATVATDAAKGQAPRDMDIAVNPNNANEVHIAGINTWRSLDAGVSFSPTSNWSIGAAQNNNVGYAHADVDLLEFVGSTLYTTNDGGVFKATNSAGTISSSYFTDLSSGLGIRQFYAFGISQTNPVVMTGGAQDNGSVTRTSAGIWRDWLGGDGMEGFVDKTNSQTIYGTAQNGSLNKSLDGGVTRIGISSPESKEGNWVTPFEQDPVAVDVIYAGYDQVYKSTDQGDNWTPISQLFSSKLNQLKISPSVPTTMYAAHSDKIFKTTTGSGTWAELTSYTGGYVNSIAIHPTDPNKVAVATTGSEHVFVTTDGGTSWTSYKYDLPNFSAFALAWDNNANSGLYLGMDYGIYYIDNTTSNSWKPFTNLLPNVKIAELEVNYADDKLYAATYGRGVWRSPRYNNVTLGTVNAELVDGGISIYPNPAKGSFYITSDKEVTASIRIFDGSGKLMHYTKDAKISKQFKIDISQYTAGLYFVRINNENGVITKKLLVK